MKKAEVEARVKTLLDVYALSQHALNLPALERPLPTQLPEGITLDEARVELGDDKGVYVGLRRRPKRDEPG